MRLSANADWLFKYGLGLLSMTGCTALDDRTVTLHNGEECSSRRQCESLHCELAAETSGEIERHICCSISCASGSACAPSGTSCVVCAAGECESACEGDDCPTDEQVEGQTKSDDTAPDDEADDNIDDDTVDGIAPDDTNFPVEPTNTSHPEFLTTNGVSTNTELTSTNGAASCAVSPSTLADAGDNMSSTQAPTTSGEEDDGSSDDVATSTAITSETTDETVPPDEVPECGQPLLSNGDFEDDMDAWTEETSYVGLSQRVHPWVVSENDESVSSYDAVAQSGSYFAYVGGTPDDPDRGHYSGIVQSVVIPTDAVALWLRGYVWVSTDDEMNDEYDFGFIQIERTPEDEQYRQFDFWTNLDVSSGWVEFEALMEDLADLPGKRVRLLVGSITDEGGVTRFWFDDLRLEGICE